MFNFIALQSNKSAMSTEFYKHTYMAVAVAIHPILASGQINSF